MFLDATEAKSIADRLIARASADACVVRIEGGEESGLRFARGGATTNFSGGNIEVRVSAHVDGRVGTVTASSLDEATLDAALARAGEIARLLPADPDYVAPLGPQNYGASNRYDSAMEGLSLSNSCRCGGRRHGRRQASRRGHFWLRGRRTALRGAGDQRRSFRL